MEKVHDYRQHAEECRSMAGRASKAEHREMLLNMAAIWDSLAEDRQADAVRKQRLADLQARLVAPASSKGEPPDAATIG